MRRLLVIAPIAFGIAAMASAQDSTSASGGYDSEGYGHRAEVFATGFGLLANSTTGNSVTHDATTAGGFSAGYRFHLNGWSAFEGRYGFSRNSQKYDTGGTVSSIPTYLAEVTGSYVYSLPGIRRAQPFLEAGGGILHFSPFNYGNGSSSSNGNPYPGGGTPAGPYSVIGSAAAPVYTSSSPGVNSQTQPTFVYGAGIDLPLLKRLSVRIEYRGFAYKTPDFGITPLKTNAFGFLSEPSLGFAYRF